MAKRIFLKLEYLSWLILSLNYPSGVYLLNNKFTCRLLYDNILTFFTGLTIKVNAQFAP